jgi:hypothetical protein
MNDAVKRRAIELHAVVADKGSIQAAQKFLGMSWSSAQQLYQKAITVLGLPDVRSSKPSLGKSPKTVNPAPEIKFPAVPEDDIPISEIIRLNTRRAEKRIAAAAAKREQTITIGNAEPCAIAFVGDPHLDDDGCDWPLLMRHIEMMQRPHVYAVNVGDTTNNWTGRLMRLYAEQETSRKTARKLAKWFLTESGVKWLVWVMGNHDAWESGSDILRLMNTTGIVMDDWSARFSVQWANGLEVPFWVAHDFPGTSQWNRMHGLMKAAMMRGGAAVYAAGHRLVSGLHWEPLEDKDAAYWALRSKGYKALDSHAVRIGYGHTDDGQTTAVVVNPREKDPREVVQGFKSLTAAIAYRDAIA